MGLKSRPVRLKGCAPTSRHMLAQTPGLKISPSQPPPEATLKAALRFLVPAFVAPSWHHGPPDRTRKFGPTTLIPQQPGQRRAQATCHQVFHANGDKNARCQLIFSQVSTHLSPKIIPCIHKGLHYCLPLTENKASKGKQPLCPHSLRAGRVAVCLRCESPLLSGPLMSMCQD